MLSTSNSRTDHEALRPVGWVLQIPELRVQHLHIFGQEAVSMAACLSVWLLDQRLFARRMSMPDRRLEFRRSKLALISIATITEHAQHVHSENMSAAQITGMFCKEIKGCRACSCLALVATQSVLACCADSGRA